MDETRPKVRLYVTAPLAPGADVRLEAGQAHYLRNVMRLSAGERVCLFNGADGEWQAEIADLGKKGGRARTAGLLRPQAVEPDLWLLFAPVKRAPLDLLVQKAVELGVSRLLPVITRRTVVDRVNTGRLLAIAIEAAEQCGRLSVPALAMPSKLDTALDGWPDERHLYYCDVSGAGRPMTEALVGKEEAPGAVLIGPEGGFDPRERAWLADLPFATPVSLGPRILRAETAALAALVLWQALAGDWGRTPGEAGESGAAGAGAAGLE